MLKAIDTCLQNTGRAYELTIIVGDCFCTGCGRMIKMQEPEFGNCFFGQCLCGRYIEASILLDRNGFSGCWIERESSTSVYSAGFSREK